MTQIAPLCRCRYLPKQRAARASWPSTSQYILALQRASNAPKPLPLAIMTSDDTHDATAALLEEHNYFGAQPQQVTLMKQGKVPCLADNSAKLAMDADDAYAVLTKPHGHGDVHGMLHSKGIARSWAKQGFEWLALFQDTNALVFRGLIPTRWVRSTMSCQFMCMLHVGHDLDWKIHCAQRYILSCFSSTCAA